MNLVSQVYFLLLFSPCPILLRRDNANPLKAFSRPSVGLEITLVLYEGSIAMVVTRCQVPVQVREFVGFTD